MKILLVLWAIGLAECDKLDRTYLPPSSSATAGGFPGDLNLPSQLPKNQLSTSEPGRDISNSDFSYTSKYPNIALGIDRQAPNVTAYPKFLVNRPGIPVSKNIYNVPTAITSYDYTPTSTLSPQKFYYTNAEPMITQSQKYTFTTSPLDPNLTYDQYLIQQNIKPHKFGQSVPTFIARDSTSNTPNENFGESFVGFPPSTYGLQDGNVQQKLKNQPFNKNTDEYMIGQTEKTYIPESQLTNSHSISGNLTPYNFSKNKYPTIQHGDNIDGTSKVPTTDTSYPDKYNNQQAFETFSMQQAPNKSDSINVKLQDAETGLPVVKSGQSFVGAPALKKNVIPSRSQAEGDKNADIIKYDNIITPEGFAYSFDTSNGIHVDESGTAVDGVKAKGSYTYTGDDGKVYNIEYTADENGFQPRGNHLPTAPPIPDAILKNIEQAEKNRKLGIIDDGSYDDVKYGHSRYQGLMGQLPPNQYNGLITKQPSITEMGKQSKTKLFKTVGLPMNNSNVFGTSNNEPDNTFNSPNNLKDVEVYRKDSNENNLSSSDNAKINEPRNEFGGNINNSRVDENLTPNSVQNLGILRSMGYEYSQPQNMFDDNNKNNFQSRFSSMTKHPLTKPDGETNYERKTPNSSFNSKSRKPDNSQTFRKTFKDPIITPGNINYIETLAGTIDDPTADISKFYNRESDQISNEGNIGPKGISSTNEPKYESSTLRPYDYRSPYISNSNDISTTIGPKFSTSTTPPSSEISSPFTSSTDSFPYSQTTPNLSQVTSTFRPSISSRRPTSGLTSRPPGYTGRITGLEQVEDSRTSPLKPDNSGQRVIGSPGYQGRHNKIPIRVSEDFKPGPGVSTDPTSQNFQLFSRPENFGSQSSTEKVVGEDFNGPKQPERFDPKHGYYY